MSDLAADRARTPWLSGRFDGGLRSPKLLFGRMFEDAAIERRFFPPDGRMFCIASAGCTALELARHGAQVTAVDINPSQTAYVERRLRGGECERGSADRVMAVLRNAARCCGLRRELLVEFLEMDDPAMQVRFWRERIDRPALRSTTRLLLSDRVLRLAYAAPLVRAVPASFADVLWSRLERGIGRHPNRTNPYAWQLFLGEGDTPSASRDGHGDAGCAEPRPSPGVQGRATPAGDNIELRCADAANYLAKCPAGVFHGITLSNILDGADAGYAARLCQGIRHAAAANAPIVLRSFAEPRNREEHELAAADRSLLWGRVVARPVEEFEEAPLP